MRSPLIARLCRGGGYQSGYTFSKYLFFFAFASTATTIVSGAVAGRLKFAAYMLFSACNILIYAFPAHWVWAPNGWLATAGFHDFAGDGPVHLLGACNGLVGTVMLGAREGRFEEGGHRRYQPSSHVTVILGLFMLWWGWIGFVRYSSSNPRGGVGRIIRRSAGIALLDRFPVPELWSARVGRIAAPRSAYLGYAGSPRAASQSRR